MNIIAPVITFIQSHWADIVAVVTQTIGVASIIVKLTPTLADDDVLKGVIRFLGKYIALNTDKGTSPKA